MNGSIITKTPAVAELEETGTGVEEASRQEAKQAVALLVREYLHREKQTIGWLAEQLGVHRGTLSRILHQKVLPDASTCRALAQVMHLSQEHVLATAGYFTQPGTFSSSSSIPELDDPELGFYLSQIGQMPEKTREIVKLILRQEYEQLQLSGIKGDNSSVIPTRRPAFARPYSPPPSPFSSVSSDQFPPKGAKTKPRVQGKAAGLQPAGRKEEE